MNSSPHGTFGSLRMFVLAMISAASILACASSPSTKDMPVVTAFDEKVFEGKWYEIARIPINIARDWVGTTDTYIRNPDGTWLVLYEGFEGGFEGKQGLMKQNLKRKEGAPAGELLAEPFPFLWLPYRLVYWNEKDLTMLVTSGTTDFLWLMAKAPIPPEAVYASLIAEAKRLGFDVGRIERVPQRR